VSAPSVRASTSDDLRVGGLTRLSSVDWPGELVATVFVQGCPWDCAYCHNPHLLARTPAEPAAATSAELVPWRAVMTFLESRVGLLDGVVFSGGEPLAQTALAAAMQDVRSLGMRVALHTNGVVPSRLGEVLGLVDWAGFDAKAPLATYEDVTGVVGSGKAARESLRLLVDSGVAHEVRTTVHPDLLGEAALLQLADELRELGVERWVLQPFRADGVRPGLRSVSARESIPTQLCARLAEGFSAFEIRE
jgi:pyruvate formate lyase activating enzyme